MFKIEEMGAYSEIVDSQFGIHIIRLDDIKPKRYRPYSEVSPRIAADIVNEVRRLANQEIRARFSLSDEAFIDGDEMESIFAPYK